MRKLYLDTAAEQGGLIDWFRNLFKKKPKTPHKEDTLDFKLAGESRPEVDGRQMNIKQLTAYANDPSRTTHNSLIIRQFIRHGIGTPEVPNCSTTPLVLLAGVV